MKQVVSGFDLLLAIVSHRNVAAPTVHSLEGLRMASKEVRVNLNHTLGLFVGDALISRGRSQACTKFLQETNIPYMLFVDEDIIFTPEDVQKVYNHLVMGRDVIGGIYPVRGATQLSSYGWDGLLEMDGGIHEIEYLATGFMGITRNILAKMVEELHLPILNPNDWAKCYPFFACGPCLRLEGWKKQLEGIATFDDDGIRKVLKALLLPIRRKGDPIYISEDWDFCEKVRNVGGKVWADTSIQVGHLREQVYTCEDVKQLQSKAIMEQRVWGAMKKHAEINKNKGIQDLSEFLHLPLDVVQKKMGLCQQTLAEKWNNWKAGSLEFYKDNQDYLYDLMFFNSQDAYFADRMGQVINITGLKILDIGCGIGTAAFVMADQGNEVVGWDINQKSIDFCEWKKKKYDLKGTFTTEQPDFSQFDLIIAIDVLEHIEDLQGFLKALGTGMKRGAKLYHSDYFPRGESNAWPMHFEENAKGLSKWLEEAGLIEWKEAPEQVVRWAVKS